MTHTTRYSEADLVRARDRFYPDWWLHRTHARMTTDMPSYHIVCRSIEEHLLAMICKPHYVHATVTLVPASSDCGWEVSEAAEALQRAYPEDP